MSFPLSLSSASCLLLALLGCQSAHRVSEPLTEAILLAQAGPGMIEAGRITDLDLVAGIDWQTAFALEVDSYLQLAVEQRNLDIGIRVVDTAGESLGVVDGSGGIGVDERLAIRLAPGEYRLVLRPRPGGSSMGRVRLRIEALRPLDASDSERLRLVLLGQQAADLDGAGSQSGWERAVHLSREELAGWRRLGDSKAVIRTLMRLTSLERALGQLASSMQHGEEAVALSVGANLASEEAASRYWLAQSLNRAGKTEDAAIQFETGLVAAESAGDLVLQGRILIWQGRMSEERGNLEQARTLYQRALELRRQAHDTRGINSAINNLAVIAKKMGDFPLALRLFKEAIEEAHQLGNPDAELRNNSNLSDLLAARGQWQEALDSLTAGLEIARSTDDQRNESTLGSKLARLLLTLGEPEPARRLLRRSLELDVARQNRAAQASALITLGQLDLHFGDLEAAETWMLEAYDLSTRLDLSAQKGQVTRSLAALRRKQQRPEQALELLAPLVDDAQSSGQPLLLADSLRELAEVHLDLGDPSAALAKLELASKALGNLPVPEVRFEISYSTARARHAEGNLNAAVDEVERALEMFERLRLSVDDPDLRATFLSRGREAYDFAIGRLLELDRVLPGQGYDRQAFATLERARARSLVEMLARARFGAERGLDPALLEAERNALAAVNEARQMLLKAAAAGGGEALSLHHSELQASRHQLTLAEEALRQAEPRYASLRYADNYAMEELQAMLEPGVALVEYSLQPGQSVAFVITESRFEVVVLAAEEAIQRCSTQFRESLTSPNRRAYETLLRRALQLGDLVVAPLAEALSGIHHLIVVPDGALAYIPFESLRLRTADSGEDVFLIERWATSYSPSAGVLRTLRRDQEQPLLGLGWVAFADPLPPKPPIDRANGASVDWPRLPGARQEVATIADSLGDGPATAYLDAAASENALKRSVEVSGARWIHLAAHARIDHQTPDNSAIVLAPDALDDGYLTVQEIFALQLHAELVVLSGCETALGRQIRGEGLIGLTRAFLYAGARGIQVSLWQVSDDSTPALMASFYANLSRDLGPAEALRAAKLASLADPRRSHPFYWAPFVFIGD